MVDPVGVQRPNSDSYIVMNSNNHQQAAGRPKTRRKIHRQGGFVIRNKGRGGINTTAGDSKHAAEPIHKQRKDSPMPSRYDRIKVLRSASLSALPHREGERGHSRQHSR